MPDQVHLEYPRVIQHNLLSYSLNIVPSCISMHNNNIALGHETGITVLSALPRDSKLNLSVSESFAKNHTFKTNNEYSKILNDVQNIKYTSNFLVVSNSSDHLLIIDHINSTHFRVPSSGVITSFDVFDGILAVIYKNKLLQIWDLTQQRVQLHLKLRDGAIVRFNNSNKEVIVLECGNEVQTIDYNSGEITSRHKLNSNDIVIDIIGGLKPTIIYRDSNSNYLRPSIGTNCFAQLVSGVLETSNKRIYVDQLSKSPVIDGEVSDNIAVVVAGTKLFLIKTD